MHVDASREGPRTRVRFPPPPPFQWNSMRRRQLANLRSISNLDLAGHSQANTSGVRNDPPTALEPPGSIRHIARRPITKSRHELNLPLVFLTSKAVDALSSQSPWPADPPAATRLKRPEKLGPLRYVYDGDRCDRGVLIRSRAFERPPC